MRLPLRQPREGAPFEAGAHLRSIAPGTPSAAGCHSPCYRPRCRRGCEAAGRHRPGARSQAGRARAGLVRSSTTWSISFVAARLRMALPLLPRSMRSSPVSPHFGPTSRRCAANAVLLFGFLPRSGSLRAFASFSSCWSVGPPRRRLCFAVSSGRLTWSLSARTPVGRTTLRTRRSIRWNSSPRPGPAGARTQVQDLCDGGAAGVDPPQSPYFLMF